MQSINDLKQKLKAATSEMEVNQVLISHLALSKHDLFSYTCYDTCQSIIQRVKYDICSIAYANWHRHYLEENYGNIDSTHQKVSNNQLPLFWKIEDQLKAARTQKEKRMRKDSIAYGIKGGVSVPIHSSDNLYANFLIATRDISPKAWDDFRQKEHEFFLMAYYYHHYLHLHLAKQLVEPHTLLSNREKQCLQLIARQLNVKSIAQMLNITERTVNFHIQNINKKLGVKNKHQAVMIAKEKGILST